MHKTVVIIPNWNGRELLADCIDSLLSQHLKPKILIVDNGSTDGSVKFIESSYDELEIIKLPKNIGFAGGVNAGINHALLNGYENIILFNNDAVADPYWVSALEKAAASHPEAGIIVSKICHMDKKHLDSTGELMYRWGVAGPRGRGEKDKGQFENSEFVFGGSGGASLYKSIVFETIGSFDEDFFAYYEDVDLSFRAQLSGWKVLYEPNAVVFHHINATSGRINGFHSYHMAKNIPWVYLKNFPGFLFFKCLPRFIVFYLIVLLGMVRAGNSWSALKGVSVSLILAPKKLVQRYKIQKNRVVNPSYISSILTDGLPPGASKLNRVVNFLSLK